MARRCELFFCLKEGEENEGQMAKSGGENKNEKKIRH